MTNDSFISFGVGGPWHKIRLQIGDAIYVLVPNQAVAHLLSNFSAAALDGLLSTVREHILYGRSGIVPDARGRRQLDFAAHNGLAQCVKLITDQLILDSGVEAIEHTAGLHTALQLVCGNGQGSKKTIRILINAGNGYLLHRHQLGGIFPSQFGAYVGGEGIPQLDIPEAMAIAQFFYEGSRRGLAFLISLNKRLTVWLSHCLHRNYADLAKLFIDYADPNFVNEFNLGEDQGHIAYSVSNGSSKKITAMAQIVGCLNPSCDFSLIKIMLAKGWSPNAVYDPHVVNKFRRFTYSPLMTLGCYQTVFPPRFTLGFRVTHKYVFNKVMELFIASGNLLIPMSPEEMLLTAISAEFKWVLIKYVQKGIVTPEIVKDYGLHELQPAEDIPHQSKVRFNQEVSRRTMLLLLLVAKLLGAAQALSPALVKRIVAILPQSREIFKEVPSLKKICRTAIRNRWLQQHGFNSITPEMIRSSSNIPITLHPYFMFSDFNEEVFDGVNIIAQGLDPRRFTRNKLSNLPLPQGSYLRSRKKRDVVLES